MKFRQPNALSDGAYPGFGPRQVVENGLHIEYDLAVAMRDGVEIYVDVYRPENTAADLPVIIAWSPYGKHGGRPSAPSRRPESGVREEWISGYTAIEAPDPAYWCAHGYSVVYPDPRGTWKSGGDFTMSSDQEAEDFHDLIEWAGGQDWSNGKVGLSGVSYLSISQWRVAATKPSHLAAINPWEGLTDMYRDLAYHGGIPESNFTKAFARHSIGYSSTQVEDLETLFADHPLADAYWKSKTAQLDAIDVPAYVVASWSNQGLHSRGTLEGFKKVSSPDKWLEVHGRKTWEYYYQPENVEQQRKFFDHTLKGVDNDWPERPRVLLEVRDQPSGTGLRAEREWPVAETKYTPLYLDAATRTLSAEEVVAQEEIRYEATGDDRAEFDYLFTAPTELVGHMKLRLWVEAVGSDDADLFVAIQKIDADGAVVGFPFFALYDHGPVALGWLRASHRELDENLSTPWQPWHPHRSEDPLRPGVPVAAEIEILPSATYFAAGERLRVVVQGSDVYKNILPGHEKTRNAGHHVLHTGGTYDSHLLVPVVPARR